MVKLLKDHNVMDIIEQYILYLYEYQKYLIKMLMVLKAYELINNNLHTMKQIFSFH